MFNRYFLEGYRWQASGRRGHQTGTLMPDWCWAQKKIKGKCFTMAQSRYLLSEGLLCRGASATVVGPDLTVVKVTKRKEAGQQASVTSAICSQHVYFNLPSTWFHNMPSLVGSGCLKIGAQDCFRCPGYLIWYLATTPEGSWSSVSCLPALCGCLWSPGTPKRAQTSSVEMCDPTNLLQSDNDPCFSIFPTVGNKPEYAAGTCEALTTTMCISFLKLREEHPPPAEGNCSAFL